MRRATGGCRVEWVRGQGHQRHAPVAPRARALGFRFFFRREHHVAVVNLSFIDAAAAAAGDCFSYVNGFDNGEKSRGLGWCGLVGRMREL